MRAGYSASENQGSLQDDPQTINQCSCHFLVFFFFFFFSEMGETNYCNEEKGQINFLQGVNVVTAMGPDHQIS